ncbi:MAG: peptidase M15 [Prevotella sp.]|nr:peptidase M15 [Prevotella sp.]
MMKTIFDATMRLSEHFTLGEMCYSATAEAKKIPNIPLKQHITAMQNLCERGLEPLCCRLGLPIKVNSGYRCQLLNQMVGGVPTSQHLKGEAADITIPLSHRPFGHSTDEQAARLIMRYAEQYADFDQLILEHRGNSWWVHISCRIDFRKNRKQVLKS